MSAYRKLLVGSAGLAAVIGAASPAAAQYYPNQGYGNGYGYNGYGNGYNNGYGNNVGNAVSQAINGVIAATRYGNYRDGNYGYGQSYGYGQQRIPANVAVEQCARVVEARLSGYDRGGYNGGYDNRYGAGYGGGYGGYDSRYGGGYGGGARVTGITKIEQRNRGAVRVFGVASQAGGYNQGYGAPGYSFSCKVDYAGRVIDLDLDRTQGYRGW